MSQGFAVVIGMSIAYAASFAGMLFAYLYYRKHKGEQRQVKPQTGGRKMPSRKKQAKKAAKA